MKKIIELETLYYNYEDEGLRNIINYLEDGFNRFSNNIMTRQCIQSRPIYVDIIMDNETHNNVQLAFVDQKWYPITKMWVRTSSNQVNVKEKVEIDTEKYIDTIYDIENLVEYIKKEKYTQYIPIR
ncbi:hypothetical protein HBE96_23505 [Clostridium sp. P21]|uniref:Uncharacterized protein n=1 Tax=Clostridium muellerianum TaxID=2716538 RepID=A0A7Y0EL97_9CLOT|nr:hypothetical protein [Clostridium muellerianum]NMM65548.1 hypothetical protein [Clostridium muellerianum]